MRPPLQGGPDPFLAQPLDFAPGAGLTGGALDVAAEGAPRDPERQGEDAHGEFDMGDTRPDLALRACDHRGSSLVGTDGVHGLVAIHLMAFDQRLVLQ